MNVNIFVHNLCIGYAYI